MHKTGRVTRRDFLRRTGVHAVGLGLAATGCARIRGAVGRKTPETVPPSEKITIGMIGVRNMGGAHLGWLLRKPDVVVAAVCDVDESVRLEARARTDNKADAYNDYRRLLERNDIDAVLIATPDHWHGLTTVHACQAGKDVYVEKPLALTIEEGRAMVDAARRYGRIVQMGTQQRSQDHFRHVCELVRNGRIGRVSLCRTWIGPNPHSDWVPDIIPPAGLDWDMWLGPAPWVPYNPQRHPYNFRYFRDYSGGLLTDWGVHLNDIVQWGMGTDHTGPRAVDAKGTMYPDNMFEWPRTMEIKYEYDNFDLIWTQGIGDHEPGKGYGIKFYGEKGSIFVDRSEYRIHADEEIDETIGSDDIQLYRSNDQQRNWLDCIKTRELPISDVDIGHHATLLSHLGNISFLLGRKLQWDPESERFVGDDVANRMVGKPYRAPWHL
jgi:predicted dehydrogenase